MVLRAAVAVILVMSPLASHATADSEEYTLFVKPDSTKVSIESGNLTMAVMWGWPRVCFWHTTDLLSPTFEVGFPRMYLFNDTDGNGMFSRSEANLTVFMDRYYADWVLSPVELSYNAELGEFARFSMYSNVSAYDPSGDGPPRIEDLANVTFSFAIAENPVVHESSPGTYVVDGKTNLWVGISVQLLNHTNLSCLATETFLQGGASTMLFNISGQAGLTGNEPLILSARTDETVLGGNFTRPLNETGASHLSIGYAKEDGEVRAFYARSSEATYGLDNTTANSTIPSSCYTTGSGLVLHSVMQVDEAPDSISVDSYLGIYDENFTARIRDLVKENLPVFAGIVGLLVIIAAVASFVVLRRRRQRRQNAPPGELGPSED